MNIASVKCIVKLQRFFPERQRRRDFQFLINVKRNTLAYFSKGSSNQKLANSGLQLQELIPVAVSYRHFYLPHFIPSLLKEPMLKLSATLADVPRYQQSWASSPSLSVSWA